MTNRRFERLFAEPSLVRKPISYGTWTWRPAFNRSTEDEEKSFGGSPRGFLQRRRGEETWLMAGGVASQLRG